MALKAGMVFWPLARVAERSGFGSLDALHRAFQKRLGATPGDYRQRFGPSPASNRLLSP